MRLVSLKRRIMAAALAAAITMSFGICLPSGVMAAQRHRDQIGGSAGSIEGRTAVVTIFVDEENYAWDFNSEEDVQKRDNVNLYLGIAGKYLESQVASYGKHAEFVTDFVANPDLYYRVRINRDMTSGSSYSWYEDNDEAVWDAIDRYVDVDAVMEAHDADNVIFLTVFNTDEASPAITCTRSWYQGMPCDYEIVYLYYIDYQLVNPPAVYAHEMLHTFGAPDLYQTWDYYGITDDNIYALQRKCMNDIMLTCSDPVTGRYVYDRVPNELTDITAFYIYLEP